MQPWSIVRWGIVLVPCCNPPGPVWSATDSANFIIFHSTRSIRRSYFSGRRLFHCTPSAVQFESIAWRCINTKLCIIHLYLNLIRKVFFFQQKVIFVENVWCFKVEICHKYQFFSFLGGINCPKFGFLVFQVKIFQFLRRVIFFSTKSHFCFKIFVF